MTLDFRYRRLGYVAINVGDLPRSLDFYRQMVGLDDAGDGPAGERLLRCSERHHDLVLHAGGTPGLRRVGWEMESADDVARVRTHLMEAGSTCVPVTDEDRVMLGVEDGFRISEPITGVTFEYYHAMTPAASPYAASVTKIERLGHVVVGTDRYDEAERHFVDTLNFRTSDRMNPAVFWLRCFPNPLHHAFGIGRAATPRLHHVNFMVTDIDDIGKALWRFRKNSVPIVFGPGRHPPSDSIFLYFLDPDRLTLEFSFGMEEFPEHGARAPRDLVLGPSSVDYWGAVPAPEFAATGAIERMEV